MNKQFDENKTTIEQFRQLEKAWRDFIRVFMDAIEKDKFLRYWFYIGLAILLIWTAIDAMKTD